MYSSGISELVLVVKDVRSSARFYEEVGRFDPDANLIEWWSRRPMNISTPDETSGIDTGGFERNSRSIG